MNEAGEAYTELRVRVPREVADAVCNYIIDNIVKGLVLEDEDDQPEVGIIFYVPEVSETALEGLRSYLTEVLPAGASVPEIKRIGTNSIKWEDEYRKSVQPVSIGDDIVVRPPWHIEPVTARYDIIIEPKMAFGTGTHETTRGSLRAIRSHFEQGQRFLDMGCGSGILSILASKLGASYIKAVDNDTTAVENCRENFEINKVQTPNEVVLGSIDVCQSDGPYEFVCANIIRETILGMLDGLISLTAHRGTLVLSGLLDKDETEITAALTWRQVTDFTIDRDGEWLTYTVRIDKS